VASLVLVLLLTLLLAGAGPVRAGEGWSLLPWGGLSSGGGPAASPSYSLVVGSIGGSVDGVTSNAGQVMTPGLVPGFVPASSFAGLELADGWNLVGVPAPYAASDIPGLLSCYGYTGSWFAVTGSDPLQPGNGYWVEVTGAHGIAVAGPYATSPFTVNAAAPWHLLGNPFEVSVPVSSITGHEHFLAIYGYGPSWFAVDLTSGVLEPGRGYWVQLDVPITLTLTRP